MCYKVSMLDQDLSEMKKCPSSLIQSCSVLYMSKTMTAQRFSRAVLSPLPFIQGCVLLILVCVKVSSVVLNDELNIILHIVGVGADTIRQDTHFHGAISTARKDVIAWCTLDLHDTCA